MPRPPRPGVLFLSPSAIEKLSGCEAAWHRHQTEERKEGASESPGRPLVLGSAVGEGLEAYHLAPKQHLSAANTAIREMARRETGWSEKWNLPDPYPSAEWMLKRYDVWYGAQAHKYEMRNTEVPYEHRIHLAPGRGVYIRGYLDGLATYRDDVWGVEYKTSGKMDRFQGLEYELQPWSYMLAMRKIGVPMAGMLYEYGLTYQYKDEAKSPVEKTWHRKEVPWDDALGAHYEKLIVKAAVRALAIESGELEPMLHIGRSCQWCVYRQPCLRPNESTNADA